MAKSDLEIKIGAILDGDGFKKADNALKTTAKAVGNAGKLMGELDGQLKSIGGTAGRVTGAISGLFGAFAQGGVAGVAMAGITMLTGKLISMWKKCKEKAEEAAKAIVESYTKAAEQISNRFKKVSEDIGKAKDNADFNISLRNKENKLTQNAAIRNIQQKALEARSNAKSDVDKQRITVQEKFDIAKVNSQSKVNDAQSNYDKLQESRISIGKQIANAEGEKAGAQYRINNIRTEGIRSGKTLEDIEKEILPFRNIISTATQDIKDLNEKLKKAQAEELIAEKELIDAKAEQTLTIKKETEIRDEALKKINDSLPKFDLVGIVKDSFKNILGEIKSVGKDTLMKALQTNEGLLKEKQEKLDDLNKNHNPNAVKEAENKLAEAEAQRDQNLSMSFGDWRKQQKDAENQQRKADRIRDRNKLHQEKELKRLQSKRFKTASDYKKISEISSYLNIPNIKEAEKLTEQAKKNQENFFKKSQQMQTDIGTVATTIQQIKDVLGI